MIWLTLGIVLLFGLWAWYSVEKQIKNNIDKMDM